MLQVEVAQQFGTVHLAEAARPVGGSHQVLSCPWPKYLLTVAVLPRLAACWGWVQVQKHP